MTKIIMNIPEAQGEYQVNMEAPLALEFESKLSHADTFECIETLQDDNPFKEEEQ